MVRLKVASVSKSGTSSPFQFQNGAIKSKSWANTEGVKESFNSKMVRLKENNWEVFNNLKYSFNSKMVRLKVVVGGVGLPSVSFQFQNGAIKSQLRKAFDVWFDAFQFQNGAIKRFLSSSVRLQKLRFNSKMVRLKEFSIYRGLFQLLTFQFQNGAIKS